MIREGSEQLREAKKRIRLLEQENEVLRRAAAYLARDINQMMYLLVRDLAAADAPVRVPVAVTCRVLASPGRPTTPGRAARSASVTVRMRT
ncbi:hypothetical protein GCM10022220_08360 [Actinocatenispora rupis]|uniref:Transposase n=1 Tax=Actinocatenispora rupis TaxID=519421 RepID=A0A8J3IUJ6_9ACTN|nr:hypothetical protein Aru02nite_10550 [Actinocatenispora rupis]